jgi:hypothetical protein
MAIELGASTGIGLLGTVQALWIEAWRPAGSATALADIVNELDCAASAAAFVVAGVVAVAAISVAQLTRRRQPETVWS